jgi:hypothetical protein
MRVGARVETYVWFKIVKVILAAMRVGARVETMCGDRCERMMRNMIFLFFFNFPENSVSLHFETINDRINLISRRYATRRRR